MWSEVQGSGGGEGSGEAQPRTAWGEPRHFQGKTLSQKAAAVKPEGASASRGAGGSPGF